MKTIDEFINEIKNSEALRNELKTIKNGDELTELLKKYEVDGNVDDLGIAITAKAESEGEISDDDVENVAGGGFFSTINLILK